MLLKTYLGLVVLASSSLAAPLNLPEILGQLIPREVQKSIPRGWFELGVPHPSTTLNLRIGLKQSNIKGLQDKLADISNPKSPNYRQWLSLEEVNSYKRPADETVSLVKQWLTTAGIQESSIQMTSGNDWLSVDLPINSVETLLGTTYSLFSHPTLNHPIPRTLQYSVPENLHSLIDTIQPTTAFYVSNTPGLAHDTAKRDASDSIKARQSSCDPNGVTPTCLKDYYNVDYTPQGKSSIGVTGLLGYGASHSDAQSFCSQYGSGCSDFIDGSIGGGNNNGVATIEGNLDTQVALGLAYPNPATYFDVGPDGTDFSDQVLNLATALSGDDTYPTSISTSYLGEEPGFDGDYMDRVCNEFMAAGSRGISVFFCSGDNGVGGLDEPQCTSSFYPIWPASCPYITAVGATQWDSNLSESVAQFSTDGSSGGGFSSHFSAPDYQSSVTAAYVSSIGSTYSGMYNPSGRGFPDVSLIGENYLTIINGSLSYVYGTSASSPAIASFISSINDYLISEGKATLGFINPLLYQNAGSAFHDVTSGSNRGCGSAGFSATQGWDPATGLGTLNYGALRSVV